MSYAEILSRPIVAFLAFFLKGIAGIGVSTVAVPILSLIIGAKQIVVLSSIVNVIGGLVMYRIDPQPAPPPLLVSHCRSDDRRRSDRRHRPETDAAQKL